MIAARSLLIPALGWMASASLAFGAITTFEFDNITGNKAADAATGEAQLFVDVIDEYNGTFLGSYRAGFLFRNVGPNASSITDVYFDNGTLLDIHQIISSSGVEFTEYASPKTLPGGQDIDFKPGNGESFFSADSDSPVQPLGVNPGEWLLIVFDLKSNQTYDDVLDAMNLSLQTPGVDVVGGLRIGIHVQGFSGGGSESFVNGHEVGSSSPPGIVPEPSTWIIWSSAAAMALGWTARRRVVTFFA